MKSVLQWGRKTLETYDDVRRRRQRVYGVDERMKSKTYNIRRDVQRLTYYVVAVAFVVTIAALWLCFLPIQIAIKTLDRRDQ